MKEYVDILIANEDEARAYTGETEPLRAVQALSREVDIAVLKLGPRGQPDVPRRADRHGRGPRRRPAAVDTTGAGDLWASGFLFGLVEGYPLEKCGALGSACGYEVCQVVGASIPEDGWQRIRKIAGKGRRIGL